MADITKNRGMGVLFGIVTCAVAVFTATVYYILYGGLSLTHLMLALGIAAFLISAVSKLDWFMLVSYFFYIAAGGIFLGDQIMTISNVLTAIDATSFDTGFTLSAIGLTTILIIGFIATILPIEKKTL
ncbi:hypothetical protein AALC16_08570 [Lachnospiraceae bacterium 29-91]